ncbi:hypothetical protein [Pseudoalteromonas byunsanensis]|uniref:hypothetical protein n=1 Tax=Pseudoalteromonas byunsanensis TaxID=327939 RepID=UPI001113D5CA|nr:hypothetical protein [Pseudoalteromonas byunsanensis]
MICNILRLLISAVIAIHLAGCEKNTSVLDYHAAKQEVQLLNNLLVQTLPIEQNPTFPFSESYLHKRHEIYQHIDESALTKLQRDELDYLKIQQRYPARYFPWPAHVNVLDNALNQSVNDKALASWISGVVKRLEAAKESNLYLSRIELDKLKGYLSNQPVGNVLMEYLRDYKPRSGIGLYQLPNGKEWYQSKLNFYYGEPVAPNVLLNQVQYALSQDNAKPAVVDSFDIRGPLALKILTQHCEPVEGLSWLDGYVNVPATVAQCQLKLAPQRQRMLLTLMEIDIGIHYQGWSYKQAMVTLQTRLELTDEQASNFVENVALHPASVLVFLSIL